MTFLRFRLEMPVFCIFFSSHTKLKKFTHPRVTIKR
uniref:Uncharacterized protein n=1 Tax=Anguilla anguilla TaxID=7936 RepID=A0A0E9RSJ0_ANGAN